MLDRSAWGHEIVIEGKNAMPGAKTDLHRRIESNQRIVIAEISPPPSGNPTPVADRAKRYAGKVHALGVSDNRDRVCMSALAAASLVAAEGVEPILHVVTRDRNRIALVSEYLGAQALGIRNLLCTTGTHQTLIRPRAAKNVFDVDSVQLLQVYSNLANDGRAVGEEAIDGAAPACLGGVATPYADPLEMQLLRLSKKVAAGAHFLVTQPVFDLDRFEAWWKEVLKRGVHRQVAVLAGVCVLTSAEQAKTRADKRPDPIVPDGVLGRLVSQADPSAQRAEGIAVAVETVKRLAGLDGLRGFSISGGDDAAAVEVMQQSGLEVD
ncbi:MAG: methylenetetrahydrofolate reductase [Planctomycetota bacterium]|jgi:methylenetetrahydrofolate reductase (NADPH)